MLGRWRHPAPVSQMVPTPYSVGMYISDRDDQMDGASTPYKIAYNLLYNASCICSKHTEKTSSANMSTGTDCRSRRSCSNCFSLRNPDFFPTREQALHGNPAESRFLFTRSKLS